MASHGRNSKVYHDGQYWVVELFRFTDAFVHGYAFLSLHEARACSGVWETYGQLFPPRTKKYGPLLNQTGESVSYRNVA